jgi:hypothetical protein
MHQKVFLTTPDVEKYLFYELDSGGLEVCANASKHVFNHSRRKKNIFFKNLMLVVWKYAQMHQNTFLTTQEVNKIIFKDLILVVKKSKPVFNSSRREKYLFLRP